ncbi:MAG: mechanosensitive ion channel [Desulfobacterales bacterium]|nr:mechanosensitive ion channel [Desulfobacterales bacterium]
MKKTIAWLFILTWAVGLTLSVPPSPLLTPAAAAEKEEDAPKIGLSEEMGDAMSRQAGVVKKQITKQARSLFKREKLGFSWDTVTFLNMWLLKLPLRFPEWMDKVAEQGRLLGIVGSLLVLSFLAVLIASLIGKKRLMARIQQKIIPIQNKIPKSIYPYILPAIQVVVNALLPIVLLAIFTLIYSLVHHDAPWFELTGRLLKLWVIADLIIGSLRELLTRDLVKGAAQYGKSIFRFAHLAVLYIIFGIGLFWAAEAYKLPKDVLALLRFAISLSIVLVLFFLALKKKALLSLLPDLPQRSYQKFVQIFRRFYFPLIALSLGLALLWSLGYRTLGQVLLAKIWSSVGAYLAIMVAYHLLVNSLERWHRRTDAEDEAAQLVFGSVKNLLVYGTTLATFMIVLNLLGLLGPLEQIMSFPVFELGKSAVTMWVFVKAALIVVFFVFLSRFSQAYLDYRIYPAVGIEPGLGYALNTFLKYLLLAIGFLVALNVVGLDLRFLLVFAGAIGIGIGMGLQTFAANLISGFTLIFGGKLRKGDWIQVAGTTGVVTDIFLRATQVRDRSGIEYLIPNTELVNGTLVNYSLGSPLISIAIPVGVTYSANPRQVESILLAVAKAEPTVSKEKPPVVRFDALADNSINFNLLVWINVKTTPERLVRSALYFAIFEELGKAGIEIPFPQRDVHIRSVAPGLRDLKPAG